MLCGRSIWSYVDHIDHVRPTLGRHVASRPAPYSLIRRNGQWPPSHRLQSAAFPRRSTRAVLPVSKTNCRFFSWTELEVNSIRSTDRALLLFVHWAVANCCQSLYLSLLLGLPCSSILMRGDAQSHVIWRNNNCLIDLIHGAWSKSSPGPASIVMNNCDH